MSRESILKTETQVITGLVRFSYAHVWEPYGIAGNEPKYSVSLLIPKSDEKTIENIKIAIKNANKKGEEDTYRGKKATDLYAILHDGDEEREGDENYKDCYFINASSKSRPQIVDSKREVIKDTTEFYSGCYGHASINFYPYNVSGKRGVACGLNNLMKIKDGEILGGKSSASSDFDGFEVEVKDSVEDLL